MNNNKIACDPGTSSPLGQLECLPCNPGQFSNSSAASECTECTVGNYAENTGQLVCDLCPKGRYNDDSGQSMCKECDAGRYGDTTGQTSSNCTGVCLSGYWGSSGADSPTCDDKCIAGRYGTGGNTDQYCDGTCDDGYNCPEGSTISNDVPCQPGTFFIAGMNSICEQCEIGKVQPLPQSSECNLCDENQFSYQNETGKTDCKKCDDQSMVAKDDRTDCICAKEHEPKNGVCERCLSGFVNRFNGNNTCTLSQGFGCVLMTNRVDSVDGTMDPDYILATEWSQMFRYPNNILRSEWGQPTEITYLTIENNAKGVATVQWFSVCPNWLMLNLGVPQRIGSIETSGCDASEDEDNVAVWVGNKIPRLWTDMSKNECDNDDIICLDHQYIHYAPDIDRTIASGKTRFLPQRNGSHLVYGQYVFVQSLQPACEIEAYETTSEICGLPSNVNPFSARFYDLQYTNNRTHHYFTTPISESIQGCTLTECMCGPNNSGRLCSNRVTSIRFDSKLDAQIVPDATVPYYRHVLCGETTEEPRGIVNVDTGMCECNAFSGTDATTDLFMGSGCQCVHNDGLICAGHGTCYSSLMPYGRCSRVSPSKQVRGITIDVLLFVCENVCIFKDENNTHYRIDRGQLINRGNGTDQTIEIQWNTSIVGEECLSFVVNGVANNYYSSAISIWDIPNENDDVILTQSGAELKCNTRNGTLMNWDDWQTTLSQLTPGYCTEQDTYWGQNCTSEIDEWECTNQTDGCWNCVAPKQRLKCKRSFSSTSTSVTGIIDLESIANCSSETIEPNWTITNYGGYISISTSSNSSLPNITTRTRSDNPVWRTLPMLVEGTLKPVDQFGYQHGRFDCSDPVDRIFATAYILNHTQDQMFYDGDLCPDDDEHTFWNVSSIGKFFGLFDTNHPYYSFDEPWEQGSYSMIKSILNNKWMIDLDPFVERPYLWEEYLTTSWTDETQWEDIRANILKQNNPIFPFNHAFESLIRDQDKEDKTSRISHAIPGKRRYFEFDEFPDESQLIERRLLEFWQSSLAPVACTNDWQCASFNLGTCVYQPSGINTNQYRSWDNGVPEWYEDSNIAAVGDEGGCACHANFQDGYWDPEWHCQRCRDGYGPKTKDEWDGLVRFNATLPQNFSLLDDTVFKPCAWPWAVDPILASDNPRSICSGHGTFIENTIDWDSNFTKPRQVIMDNQWKPLDDPSICLVFNLTGFTDQVFLQQNWVLNQPWYTNDESRSIAYFLGKPVNNTRVGGYWIHANATCHQYNHVYKH